jgi:long-chain fatty acid transport protein
MKKLFIILSMFGYVLGSVSPVFSGGMINSQNFSAEYLRTFSRNAATDSADAVFYNPAGVMKLEDGLYGNLGIFIALKDYNNKIDNSDSKSDDPSTIPGLVVLYKKARAAGYFAFGIAGGGGEVTYEDGVSLSHYIASGYLQGVNAGLAAPLYQIGFHKLEGESYYYGYTLGGSYEVNEMISVSAGLKLVDAYKEVSASILLTEATGTVPILAGLSYKETAQGFSGLLGVNITPLDNLNIGLRYETNTELDFKIEKKQDTLSVLRADGEKEQEDLPALFGLGVAYKINPSLLVHTSFTYYLNEEAKLEHSRFQGVDNAFELAVAFEYAINQKLRASLGYMYTETGIDGENMLAPHPELDVDTLGAGVGYEVKPGIDLNFAVYNSFYESDSFTQADTFSKIEYDKNVFGVAFGIQYKFM